MSVAGIYIGSALNRKHDPVSQPVVSHEISEEAAALSQSRQNEQEMSILRSRIKGYDSAASGLADYADSVAYRLSNTKLMLERDIRDNEEKLRRLNERRSRKALQSEAPTPFKAGT